MSPLTITLIQTNLHWENKDQNLLMLEDKIKNIPDKTELVILPEMFSTGFSMQPAALAEKMEGPTVQWMKNLSSTRKVVLVGSLIIEENGNYYNRLLCMLPNGQYGIYDKRHRFAFAGEHEQYTAGTKRLIASVKGWKLNLQVCYDLRFPVWARQQLSDAPVQTEGKEGMEWCGEYDLLIYVANWPEKRNHAWKTLLQARAIENQCYTIGVNRVGNDGKNIYHSGDSMIIDPLGEIVYQKAHEEDIFTYRFEKTALQEIRTRFPFWKDADDFQILL